MPPLIEHPALVPLPHRLRGVLVDWIVDLVRAANDPDPMLLLESLEGVVLTRNPLVLALSPDDREALSDWLDQPQRQNAILDLLEHAFAAEGPERLIPPITPDQLAIIQETQDQVGIYWPKSELLKLNRSQADTLIKGLIVRSEVIRTTGSYEYPIKHLRWALRADLVGRLRGGLCDTCVDRLTRIGQEGRRRERYGAVR